MAVAGPPGLFLYIAGALAIIALFTIFRMLRRTGLPIPLQGSFVPAMQTPPRIAELDPRSEDGARKAKTSTEGEPPRA